MTAYDDVFYDYINAGSLASARRMLPLLQRIFARSSVLDVGCGQGAWLSAWHSQGVDDFLGVDGAYVDRGRLLIPAERFMSHDLGTPFDLGRRFDLVQSLEVAEHLPAARAESFVHDLTRHSSFVLFSAAPPGQGGDHHVNEQPYEYWRAHFAACGFRAFDFLRPLTIDDGDIELWYRLNCLLYVADDAISQLPPDILATRVPDGQPIRDLSPPWYRVRKGLIRLLPPGVVTVLAKVNERRVARARRQSTT